MLSSNTAAIGSQETRFFGIIRNSPPLHFYLIQLVGFGYLLYRFLSRDYTVYGYLSADMFNFPRDFGVELWPIPLLHFTTFQFIYSWIPRPTPEVIFGLQMVVVTCCTAGILGILPRWNAIVAFLVALHITGMVQSSNAEVDGGSLALCVVLVLALSPSECFYRLRRNSSLSQRKVNFHWPAVLVMFVVGVFYTVAGINKIVDVGPHWPFALHLENLARYGIENSLFYADRYAHPEICSWHLSPAWSHVGGVVTLVVEAGCLGIFFLPRYRLSVVVSLAIFHGLVYAMAGINFIGSSLILFLCLDWNVFVRSASLTYHGTNPRWKSAMRVFERLNWPHTARCHSAADGNTPFSSTSSECLVLIDENGEIYGGLDAVEQACTRCPLLWPVALLLKVPGAYYCLRPLFNRRSGLVPPTAELIDQLTNAESSESATVSELAAAA